MVGINHCLYLSDVKVLYFLNIVNPKSIFFENV